MRILIADDNDCFRELLCVVLKPLIVKPEDIIEAENGAEAIAYAECYQPDVILMDVMMPEVNGFEALKELKAGEHTTDIPVVLMSAGCVNDYYIGRGLKLGARDYLKKPFDIFSLPKMLESYVAEAKKSPGCDPDLTPIRTTKTERSL